MREILNHDKLVINQMKEWVEIIANIETKNAYEIQTEQGQSLGNIAEVSGGFFDFIKRMLFRSHRPLNIEVYSKDEEKILRFKRNFFFLFSDLFIFDDLEKCLGSVHRRFGIIYKKYDLTINDKVFATVKSPLWRLWTFPIYDMHGEKQLGAISKRWQGILKEGFTDADKFLVDFGNENWNLEQKAVILGLAISIDFDFFEDNHKKN